MLSHDRKCGLQAEGAGPCPLFSADAVSPATLCSLLYCVQALPGDTEPERRPSADTHSGVGNRRAWPLATPAPLAEGGLWQCSKRGGTAQLWGSHTPPDSRLLCCFRATPAEHRERLAGCAPAAWEGWFHPKTKELPIVRNTYPRIPLQCWKCRGRISWGAQLICLMSVSHP